MATTNSNTTSAKRRTTQSGSASSTKSGAQTRTTQPVGIVERAVLIPVGAGLVVRDDLMSSLRKISKKYGTMTGLEKELGRYEKRGSRERNRFERQVKRQRTKVEREIRQRRKGIETQASSFGKRFEQPASAVGARVDGLTSKFEELISSAQGLIG